MEKYLLVLFVLIASSYLYLKLAKKYNIIDKPNERSSHTKITVRGGGIVFTIAIVLFYLLNNYQYPYFFTGVFIISVVSFLDDIYTLSSKLRFPFQFFAVFLILYQISIPFFPIPVFFLYLILGVGLVNMFNFMDGVNGITGLYSIAVLSGLYLINSEEQIINSELIIYVLVSILVFGFYNFRKKALFFAGDIGSIALGMLVVFLGFYLGTELKSPLILLLVIVYGADASLTMLYRLIFTKESVFDPHRHHIYQKLVDVYKVSHLKISIIYAILQIIVNFIVYKTYNIDIQYQLILFFGLILICCSLYIIIFKRIKSKQNYINAV
ncbi:MraY family glycosyltransferase [Polaribacter sp.]|uniref:MraY family glycosyltransferase n=1 Tax=Polaribacter sp. TaxID=1920175 RepID=UPI003EF8FE14